MSTTLLDFIGTQQGQQPQMPPLSPVEAEPVHRLRLVEAVRAWHADPSHMLTGPHHGQAVSLYDYLLRTQREDTPQFDFYSTVSNFGFLRRKLSVSSEPVRSAVDINLRIMHGNPVFRGTRIPIYQIVEELADGTPLREIPEGYPSLTVEQIQGGLDFAASVLRIYDEQISDR